MGSFIYLGVSIFRLALYINEICMKFDHWKEAIIWPLTNYIHETVHTLSDVREAGAVGP